MKCSKGPPHRNPPFEVEKSVTSALCFDVVVQYRVVKGYKVVRKQTSWKGIWQKNAHDLLIQTFDSDLLLIFHLQFLNQLLYHMNLPNHNAARVTHLYVNSSVRASKQELKWELGEFESSFVKLNHSTTERWTYLYRLWKLMFTTIPSP